MEPKPSVSHQMKDGATKSTVASGKLLAVVGGTVNTVLGGTDSRSV